MSVMVQATTDQLPELGEMIEQRHAHGLDTYDEWWEGVYRVVTGPNVRHGRLIIELGILLHPPVKSAGLHIAAPINIGADKFDAKVPDIGIVHLDVVMTSPAFAGTAELVVEIMSPGEQRGEKLPFYAKWGVREYLEVDPATGTARLLRNIGGEWESVERSSVIDLGLDEVLTVLADLDA